MNYVSVKGLSKRFPDQLVLDQIDFEKCYCLRPLEYLFLSWRTFNRWREHFLGWIKVR